MKQQMLDYHLEAFGNPEKNLKSKPLKSNRQKRHQQQDTNP
jgi:hypothetical protein